MSITIWRRRFQPAALASTFATFVVAVTWATQPTFIGPARWAAVVFAVAVGVLMTVSWATNSERLLVYGYLLSSGLWGFITWVGIVGGLTLTSVGVSIALTILAAGSYLLEVVDGDGRWLP